MFVPLDSTYKHNCVFLSATSIIMEGDMQDMVVTAMPVVMVTTLATTRATPVPVEVASTGAGT
jgi:hypothetical protein